MAETSKDSVPQGDATVRLSHILTEYTDQEGLGWPACFAWLRTYHPERIADATARIVRGDDVGEVYLDPFNKRVLDGHHRLAAWQALGWMEVDVLYADLADVEDAA
jgi:hypothetical protein